MSSQPRHEDLLLEISTEHQGVGTASFDSRHRYRYRLSRVWDSSLPTIVWCMLNPSTADSEKSDPTLDRVVGFSRRWGYGGVEVVNLFALRTTDPSVLGSSGCDPVGPANDRTIRHAARGSSVVVTAWGNGGHMPNPASGRPRCQEVTELLSSVGAQTTALRFTAAGQPGHPLYIPYGTQPFRWAPAIDSG